MYRGLVCDAAERVFAAHGFPRACMSQIARESGVSIGTIYRIFPRRKDEIYRAIHENRGTTLLGRTRAIGEAAWRQRGDLLDAMLASVAATVDFFAAHPDFLRLVLREEKGWAGSAKRSSTEQTAMWREHRATRHCRICRSARATRVTASSSSTGPRTASTAPTAWSG